MEKRFRNKIIIIIIIIIIKIRKRVHIVEKRRYERYEREYTLWKRGGMKDTKESTHCGKEEV